MAVGVWMAAVLSLQTNPGVKAELLAYDGLVQVRRWLDARTGAIPPRTKPGISIVIIDDAHYLNDANSTENKINDGPLAELIERVFRRNPAVVGVDVFRERVVGDAGGAAQLDEVFARHPNLLIANQTGFGNVPAIKTRKGLPADRSGYADYIEDADGVIRRAVLWQDAEVMSFPYLVAEEYFIGSNIPLRQDNAAGREFLRLGTAGRPLHRLQGSEGGYAGAASDGYRILMDFRGRGFKVFRPEKIDDIEENSIVLIGYWSSTDKHTTPLRNYVEYGFPHTGMPGVILQAHAVDQLLRVAEGTARAPLFWPEWAECLWAFPCILAGAWSGSTTRNPTQFVLRLALCVLIVVGISVAVFCLWSLWWPTCVPAFALLAAGFIGQQLSPRWLRVFLSYSSNDLDRVQKVYDDLRASGHFPLIDKNFIEAADDWYAAIQQQLRLSDRAMFFVSASSTAKVAAGLATQQPVNGKPPEGAVLCTELQIACVIAGQRAGRRFLLPVLLDGSAPPELTQSFQWVDWRSTDDRAMLQAWLARKN